MKVTVMYVGTDGQVFTTKAYFYEVQEALMDLTRQAAEADTCMSYIQIS